MHCVDPCSTHCAMLSILLETCTCTYTILGCDCMLDVRRTQTRTDLTAHMEVANAECPSGRQAQQHHATGSTRTLSAQQRASSFQIIKAGVSAAGSHRARACHCVMLWQTIVCGAGTLGAAVADCFSWHLQDRVRPGWRPARARARAREHLIDVCRRNRRHARILHARRAAVCGSARARSLHMARGGA